MRRDGLVQSNCGTPSCRVPHVVMTQNKQYGLPVGNGFSAGLHRSGYLWKDEPKWSRDTYGAVSSTEFTCSDGASTQIGAGAGACRLKSRRATGQLQRRLPLGATAAVHLEDTILTIKPHYEGVPTFPIVANGLCPASQLVVSPC